MDRARETKQFLSRENPTSLQELLQSCALDFLLRCSEYLLSSNCSATLSGRVCRYRAVRLSGCTVSCSALPVLPFWSSPVWLIVIVCRCFSAPGLCFTLSGSILSLPDLCGFSRILLYLRPTCLSLEKGDRRKAGERVATFVILSRIFSFNFRLGYCLFLCLMLHIALLKNSYRWHVLRW